MTFLIDKSYCKVAVVFCFLLLSGSIAGYGQSLTLASASASAGGSVSLSLSLSAATAPAGLQWKVAYPSAIASASFSAGASLTSTGKSLKCNPTSGAIVCVASGSTSTIPNGVVAVLNATLASTVSTSSVAVALSGLSGALADGTPQAVAGTGGTITVPGAQTTTPTLTNLSCSPQLLVTPGSSVCTVTLSGAAGSLGMTVGLYNNAPALTAPLSVAIPGGAASANFNVSAAAVSANETDTITATLNGVSKSASLTLQPASAATSGVAASYAFDQSSGSVATDSSGNGGTGQVSGATWAAGKFGNALSFNGSTAYVDLGTPAALQTGGSMSWSVWVYATGVPGDDGQIVARSDSSGWELKTTSDTGARTFGVGVTGIGAGLTQRVSRTMVSLNTWYHVAGVYNASARTLDVYVNGVLDNGTLTGLVPASQIIPALNTTVGRRSGGYNFQGLIDNLRIYTRALSPAEIQNDMNTPIGSGTTPPQATVSAVQCSPTSVASGASSACSVTLSAAAPGGGASVTLSDNSSALTVPASVTVPAGATSAAFTAVAGSVASNQAVTVTATLDGSSASTSLTIVAPAATGAKLSGLACAVNGLASGGSTTCTVTLSQAAPSSGATVTLTDGCSTLSVPAAVTVAAGATTATFTVTTGSAGSNHVDVITANLNGSTVTDTLRHRR